VSTLAQLQEKIQSCLLETRNNAGALVVGDERMSAAERLAIYSSAYRARLVEALGADFSALHAYLGDGAFERLVHAYLDVYPSRHFSLRQAGQNLCEFLASHAPYSAHKDLFEIALFEWSLCHAFDAADARPLTADSLASLSADDWFNLVLRFHASVRPIDLHGNIPELWSALNAQREPPALAWCAQAQPWLLWRRDLKLMFRQLDDVESNILAAFRQGLAFDRVCERLSTHLDEAEMPLRIAGHLRQWLGEGLIVHFEIRSVSQ